MKNQIHSKFKVFVGNFSTSGISTDLEKSFEEFASKGVSPKSIGAAFLEDSKSVILTMGYSTDESANYKVSIKMKPVGKFSNDIANTLEGALETASEGIDNIICHELFVAHDGNMYVIFMTAEQA